LRHQLGTSAMLVAPISATPPFAGTSPPQQQAVHLIRAWLIGSLLLPPLLAVTQPLQP
jgi:hypothetical protein